MPRAAAAAAAGAGAAAAAAAPGGGRAGTAAGADVVATLAALGGSATPIPWGELYTALQQGGVDGAENNPPSFYLSRHYEVCKYYSLDEHTSVPDILLISTVIWQGLSGEEKNWLEEAIRELLRKYATPKL